MEVEVSLFIFLFVRIPIISIVYAPNLPNYTDTDPVWWLQRLLIPPVNTYWRMIDKHLLMDMLLYCLYSSPLADSCRYQQTPDPVTVIIYLLTFFFFNRRFVLAIDLFFFFFFSFSHKGSTSLILFDTSHIPALLLFPFRPMIKQLKGFLHTGSAIV